MKKKILSGIIICTFISVICAFILITGVLHDYTTNIFTAELKNEAIYVAGGLETSGSDYFDNIKSFSSRITWIAEDGTVLFDSRAEEPLENHADREEFIEAKSDGEGYANRTSNTFYKETTYYAMLLDDGSVLRVSSEQSSIFTLFMGILTPVIAILFFALILATVLSTLISRRIVKPINEIDLDSPDISSSYDELAPFIRKIQKQNKKIKAQMHEIGRRQEEFSIITENMAEGFLVLDSHADILSCNNAAKKILDIDSDVINSNVLSVNRSDAFRNAVSEALGGNSCEFVTEINQRIYRIIANPVRIEQKLTGVIIIIIDTTEYELREKMRREFTSNVSHELKTPLTTIYGVSDMLAGGIVKLEDVPSFANNIKDESGRMITLIDDIIKLSQLDEGNIPIEKEQIDLYDLTEVVLERLKPKAHEKNVALELKGESVNIIGIRPVIDEMIYNLCDNAIKYNKDNGKVTVKISKCDSHAVITVKDTGIGIPKEHQQRVFERFYRVDKSHSRKIGGTGLGLSIVKHAVAFHGGTVTLKSTEGKGTTITVVI